ncbi:MAG: hypothetical protein R3F37_07605 [Candidatus Competibacteraceae bacterium]
MPRGADAVIMVEHTELLESADADAELLEIRRTATLANSFRFAGTDVARGETVLQAGQVLTSREIVLAAIGLSAGGGVPATASRHHFHR